jgi:uncharacterized protein (TIGR03085 family)
MPASSSPTAAERAALADLLADLGPDRPTLCTGWDTRHLAAHLVTREGRPDALPGILIPRLAGHTQALENATRERTSYDELVRRVAEGPPLGRTPMGLPGLDGPLNLHEYFVHHEDVRRAQSDWTPRELPPGLADGLWRRLALLAPLIYAKLRGVRLQIETPDGHRRVVGRGAAEVHMAGTVPELFLYAFGRREAAQVTVTGSESGRARLEALDLSV